MRRRRRKGFAARRRRRGRGSGASALTSPENLLMAMIGGGIGIIGASFLGEQFGTKISKEFPGTLGAAAVAAGVTVMPAGSIPTALMIGMVAGAGVPVVHEIARKLNMKEVTRHTSMESIEPGLILLGAAGEYEEISVDDPELLMLAGATSESPLAGATSESPLGG